MNYELTIGIDASRANEELKTGVNWYAHHLIQEFKKIVPEDVRVILYSREPLRGELEDLPVNWTQKTLKWPFKKLWTQGRLSWEMLVNAPDILFVPAHVSPLIHPKRTIMTVHDVAAVRFPESYNFFERWYSVWSARVALKRLWKVIAPSRHTKNELLQLEKNNQNSSEKISVVLHGYDERYRRINDSGKIEETLKKYNIRQPFVMSIGRLEEKKNSKRVVQSFNKLRNAGVKAQILLVGKPGYGYEEVRENIEKSGYREDIITPGWVDENDVPYLMNAAEVFVFPSLSEGFGIPVLEAMACGTPVVASRGMSLEEIGGEVPIYVDPKDVDEIARAIRVLLEDHGLWEEKATKGWKRVKEFSWGKCARETLKIIIDEER